MSTLITIADACVGMINAATLSLPVVAVRYYVPVPLLPELSDLRVSVVPITAQNTIASRPPRAVAMGNYGIDIAIQQREPPGPQTPESVAAFCDPLMSLADEIQEVFLGQLIVGVPGAVCSAASNEPVYSVEHLDKMRTFTSLITLTVLLGQ